MPNTMPSHLPSTTSFSPHEHRDGSSETPSHSAPRKYARAVREHASRYGTYEHEGSESRTIGSVLVAPRARWTARLTVPIPERNLMLVQLERDGDLPAGYRGAEERVCLSVPAGELDALLTLLSAVVADARRDGVLPQS